MKSLINTIVSAIIFVFTFLFGGFDLALQSLIVMIIADYITGLLKACYTKKLSSKVGVKGIIKKVFYLLLVVVGNIIDINLGEQHVFRQLIIFFLISNEGISILENASEMRIPFPAKLKEVLEQMKNK